MAKVTYTSVRDPQWVDDGMLQINCIVKFDHMDAEVPFTADPRDVEAHGREIYDRAASGEFGPVGAPPSGVSLSSGDTPISISLSADQIAAITMVQAYIDEANKENASGTDRGLVLVWASIIDDMLLKILDSFTVDVRDKHTALFQNQAPFAGFSNRIKAAVALGLIADDEGKAIHLIRTIRNDFAHQIAIDLSANALASKCYDLCMQTLGTKFKKQPRLSFTAACGQIMMILLHRLQRAQHSKLMGLRDERPLAERSFER